MINTAQDTTASAMTVANRSLITGLYSGCLCDYLECHGLRICRPIGYPAVAIVYVLIVCYL